MKIYWRWSQAVWMAFLLVLAGIAWAAFAPVQVGGLASYVIIRGVSMEPRFHNGDLVIVHKAMDYQVGDIAAYKNQDVKGNVFHRIVGVNLDRFVFQGDNNSWLDSYQPTKDELIGKLWIRLPKVGNAIMWIRVPLNMAFTVGILGGLIMTGTILDKPGQKGRKKDDRQTGGWGSGSIEAALIGLGLLFLGSLALGIYAFTHPVWREADPVQFEHKGTFTYFAAAEPGVYDSTTVQTGEPIFPALTCSLNVQFVYSLSAGQLQGLGGTYSITARILEEQSNWQRTIPIEPDTEFGGGSFTADATVDLCQVESLVETMEEVTDFHPASYTLAITPKVSISGTFTGEEFEDTFEPGLVLRFDKLHFFLDDSNPDIDPLNPTRAGLLQDPRPVPNRIALFGLEPKDATLRTIAIIGLVLAVIGIAALVYFMSTTARRDPQAFTKMKYGGMLVSIKGKEAGFSAHPLEVDSIDELARIAERSNSMIYQEAKGAVHNYYVNCDGKTYRHTQKESHSGTPATRPAKTSGRGKDSE